MSQGNSKDWGYDDSGLLTEIFKNYYSLYPNSIIKRFNLSLVMMNRQKWRMRLGMNPLLAIKSLLHLMNSENVDLPLKIILPFIYPYFYIVLVVSVLKKKLYESKR